MRRPSSKLLAIASLFCAGLVGGAASVGAQEGQAATEHPFAGIWTIWNEDTAPSQEQLVRKCLTDPSVTFKNGLVVLYNRQEKEFSAKFGTSYFTVTGCLQCSVSSDGVETCNDLQSPGEAPALGAIKPIDDRHVEFCELDADTRAPKEDGCFPLYRCEEALYTIRSIDYQITIDMSRRPDCSAK